MTKKLSQGWSEPILLAASLDTARPSGQASGIASLAEQDEWIPLKTTYYRGPIKLYNCCHGNQFHPQVHINHWKIHELHRNLSLTNKIIQTWFKRHPTLTGNLRLVSPQRHSGYIEKGQKVIHVKIQYNVFYNVYILFRQCTWCHKKYINFTALWGSWRPSLKPFRQNNVGISKNCDS